MSSVCWISIEPYMKNGLLTVVYGVMDQIAPSLRHTVSGNNASAVKDSNMHVYMSIGGLCYEVKSPTKNYEGVHK